VGVRQSDGSFERTDAYVLITVLREAALASTAPRTARRTCCPYAYAVESCVAGDSGSAADSQSDGSFERTDLGGVLREQKMLKGHLPRVIHHHVY